MTRLFKTVDYEEALHQTVTIEEVLSPNHLARFIVGIIAQLDLSAIYACYAPVGGVAFAPEILLGVLFYGYATGLFSSRKLEKATYESIPFRFIAGGLHPDHDTINNFRKLFLPEIKKLFVQVLQIAQEAGALKLGNVSIDGSKTRSVRMPPRAKPSVISVCSNSKNNCNKKLMSYLRWVRRWNKVICPTD